MTFYVESKANERWMVVFKGKRTGTDVKRGDIVGFDSEVDALFFCLNGKGRLLTAAEAAAHENPKPKIVKSVVDLVTKDDAPDVEAGAIVQQRRKGRKAAASED